MSLTYNHWKSITRQKYPSAFDKADRDGYIFTSEQLEIINSEENPQAFYMEKIMSAILKDKKPDKLDIKHSIGEIPLIKNKACFVKEDWWEI